MTVRRPLVNLAGTIAELPLSDTITSSDLIGGFYYCGSAEELTVADGRIVLMGNHTIIDGRVTIDGILTHN